MKLLNLIRKLGKRIERNPKAYAIGFAALCIVVMVSKWLDIPVAW